MSNFEITEELVQRDHQAKKRFIELFFEDFRRRWKNLQNLQQQFPGEGVVLALCFIEALGYYRFGFGNSELSATEQFVKIIFDYQFNNHFLVVPPLVIKDLPLEKEKRTLGRSINRDVLEWLKSNYLDAVGISVKDIWSQIPKKIINSLSEDQRKKSAHLYQISWAGLDYETIRTYGVHKGYFPQNTPIDQWNEIRNAAQEILENLKKECLDKIKWSHQLDQTTSIF